MSIFIFPLVFFLSMAIKINELQLPSVLVVGDVVKKPFFDEGVKVVFLRSLAEKEVASELGNCDVLVYRGDERIETSVFESAKKLKLLIRFGVGIDNIDLQAASEFKVKVVNVPNASTNSVAEHVIALILSLLRKVPQAHVSMMAKEWRKSDFCGFELKGKTVGLVGFGRIGKAVASRLKGFEVNLTAFDPFVGEDEFTVFEATRKEHLSDLLQDSDVVVVLVPLQNNTSNLLNFENLKFVKKSAFLVNVSRGGVVDENALVDALKKGILAGAALDVFKEEPLLESKLREFDNVILTPHIGASTVEAQREIAKEVIRLVKEFSKAMVKTL